MSIIIANLLSSDRVIMKLITSISEHEWDFSVLIIMNLLQFSPLTQSKGCFLCFYTNFFVIQKKKKSPNFFASTNIINGTKKISVLKDTVQLVYVPYNAKSILSSRFFIVRLVKFCLNVRP